MIRTRTTNPSVWAMGPTERMGKVGTTKLYGVCSADWTEVQRFLISEQCRNEMVLRMLVIN